MLHLPFTALDKQNSGDAQGQAVAVCIYNVKCHKTHSASWSINRLEPTFCPSGYTLKWLIRQMQWQRISQWILKLIYWSYVFRACIIHYLKLLIWIKETHFEQHSEMPPLSIKCLHQNNFSLYQHNPFNLTWITPAFTDTENILCTTLIFLCALIKEYKQ